MIGYTDLHKIWRLWYLTGLGGKCRPICSSDVVFLEGENAISGSGVVDGHGSAVRSDPFYDSATCDISVDYSFPTFPLASGSWVDHPHMSVDIQRSPPLMSVTSTDVKDTAGEGQGGFSSLEHTGQEFSEPTEAAQDGPLAPVSRRALLSPDLSPGHAGAVPLLLSMLFLSLCLSLGSLSLSLCLSASRAT